MCVYTVITNGFSSFHCSCTILKSRGQRYPCHFLCQRSWVTCGKDIDQGRLIYVPAIVSTVDFLFLFMSCALFSSIGNLCPLKFYCQATQEIRRRLWHPSHFWLAITPQCVWLLFVYLYTPSKLHLQIAALTAPVQGSIGIHLVRATVRQSHGQPLPCINKLLHCWAARLKQPIASYSYGKRVNMCKHVPVIVIVCFPLKHDDFPMLVYKRLMSQNELPTSSLHQPAIWHCCQRVKHHTRAFNQTW